MIFYNFYKVSFPEYINTHVIQPNLKMPLYFISIFFQAHRIGHLGVILRIYYSNILLC